MYYATAAAHQFTTTYLLLFSTYSTAYTSIIISTYFVGTYFSFRSFNYQLSEVHHHHRIINELPTIIPWSCIDDTGSLQFLLFPPSFHLLPLPPLPSSCADNRDRSWEEQDKGR